MAVVCVEVRIPFQLVTNVALDLEPDFKIWFLVHKELTCLSSDTAFGPI